MEYLLLLAGVFMGWSLGTNDAANAFGTAVATGVVKYRTAVIIISIFVIIGAYVAGSNNLTNVSKLAIANEVMTAEEDLKNVDPDDKEAEKKRVLDSALKAAIVFVCAGATVFLMSYLKFPVSANQSITGAIVGWGLFHANYSDPAVSSVALPQLGKFASTWLMSSLGAAIFAFVLVKIANKLLVPRVSTLRNYDLFVKIGYLVAGALASYSIGMNSSANVTALYFDALDDGIRMNLLTDARLTAVIGGAAIALGVLTYSKKVMMTVGTAIAPLTQIEGFLVIVAMAGTIVILGDTMGIPVSTSQAVVGAVVGAGLTKSWRVVNFGVFKNIAIAWVSSPLVAGVLSYLMAVITQGYFA